MVRPLLEEAESKLLKAETKLNEANCELYRVRRCINYSVEALSKARAAADQDAEAIKRAETDVERELENERFALRVFARAEAELEPLSTLVTSMRTGTIPRISCISNYNQHILE